MDCWQLAARAQIPGGRLTQHLSDNKTRSCSFVNFTRALFETRHTTNMLRKYLHLWSFGRRGSGKLVLS